MVRRTVSLPESVDALVKELTQSGESYSAAVARLIEEGARVLRSGKAPSYIGIGEGPEDLGINAEKYLRRLARGE
jgi:hypothetical protein